MSSRQAKWQSEVMKKLRDTFEPRCRECPDCPYQGNEMEFAHIKETGLNGRGRGRSSRYYDIKNNPDSYFLCCHEKHVEIDRR